MVKSILYSGILCILLGYITVSSSEPYEDLFHVADNNNDTFLTSTECKNLWLIFDGDDDKIISKLEFEIRWTFLNLAHREHAPVFFEQLDRNLDKIADAKEIKRICTYFDDDGDGFVSKFEYDLNWKGIFSVE
ncbi:hypothetical protein SNE40_011563 [Patella caerulea]|uniref:EF-hand domain-containing protein n=1 Tax=Patella caerulea TaxID=87958 RepID=A0AAN8PIU2_PATCE